MGGSSGSNAPQQVQQTTTNLPEYARPYFEELLGRTGAVSAQGYTPYSGQRIADTNAYTQASQGMTAQIANNGAPDLPFARQSIDRAAAAAGNNTNYQSGYDTSTYNPQATTTGTFGQNAANFYMSPYQQNVTDVQKDAAVLDFQRGRGARDDSAIRAGAFGGSRQAIQQGLANQGLATQLGSIQAQGSQNAFAAAQAQFNADQQRGLTAQSQTQADRQFGANYDDSSQRFAENARAGAAGIQQAGGAASLAAGQAYGQLASTDQTLALQRAQALGNIGTGLQQTNQASLDMGYQDFVNQRDYDRQNLNFYSGILRGTPVSAQSEVSKTEAAPNQFNQLAGLGIAGLGAYKASQA